MVNSNSILTEPKVRLKLKRLSAELDALEKGETFAVPELPARDVGILQPEEWPEKIGLSTPRGQAKLLHDLANIELQAMELAFRTLCEFPGAPQMLRLELTKLALDESEHLRLCLDGLMNSGFNWGAWPIHLSLWCATSREDDLLDRMLIVHRYLEGSGLDAGVNLLNRLKGVKDFGIHKIVRKIVEDEMGHVQFGSHWYRQICKNQGLDPSIDFVERMRKLKPRLPRRGVQISVENRRLAGFSEKEIDFLLQTANIS